MHISTRVPEKIENLLGGSAEDSLMKGLDSGVGRLREFGAPETKRVGSLAWWEVGGLVRAGLRWEVLTLAEGVLQGHVATC